MGLFNAPNILNVLKLIKSVQIRIHCIIMRACSGVASSRSLQSIKLHMLLIIKPDYFCEFQLKLTKENESAVSFDDVRGVSRLNTGVCMLVGPTRASSWWVRLQ